MKISCLGWGSLIWDPRTLPIRMPWFSDGPFLPVEFARHSSGDRITLVITPDLSEVRVLWALMSTSDLDDAKRGLAQREGINDDYIESSIGCWLNDLDNSDSMIQSIGSWAISKGLDAVIWTALRPKFGDEYRVPSIEEVIDFLTNLPHERMKYAKEYIRKAPIQIDTNYRREIERKLGWKPISLDNSSA